LLRRRHDLARPVPNRSDPRVTVATKEVTPC